MSDKGQALLRQIREMKRNRVERMKAAVERESYVEAGRLQSEISALAFACVEGIELGISDSLQGPKTKRSWQSKAAGRRLSIGR